MTQVNTFYNLEEINEEFVRKLIKNNKSVDIIGYDPIENGHSTPLTYCIFNNNKKLFQELLDYGADINMKITPFQWNALYYALIYQDDFFLKKLIATNQLDPYIKINEKNNIEDILAKQNYPKGIKVEDLNKRIKLYMNYLDSKEGLNLNVLFNNSKNIFFNIYPSGEKTALIVDGFPKQWLRNEFEKIHNYNDLYEIFKFSGIDLLKLIKKEVIDLNRVDEEGNTFGHVISKQLEKYYDNSSTNLTRFVMGGGEVDIYKKAMKIMIDNNINIHLENNNKESIHSLLKDVDFYKEYLIKQHYKELSEKINASGKSEIKKIKI